MSIDLSPEETAEILKLLDGTSHDELVLEGEGVRIVYRRGEAGGWTQETRTSRSNAAVLFEGAERPAPAAVRAGRDMRAAETGIIEIRSPLPGTFYRAPKPGAAPFVETGSPVNEHSVVAIVETMKLMNSIHAGAEGEIAEICVANGEFVEPATVLMRLRPKP